MHHQEDNILVKAVKPAEQASNTKEDKQKARGKTCSTKTAREVRSQKDR